MLGDGELSALGDRQAPQGGEGNRAQGKSTMGLMEGANRREIKISTEEREIAVLLTIGALNREGAKRD